MGALRGSIGYSKLHVRGDLPEQFADRFVEGHLPPHSMNCLVTYADAVRTSIFQRALNRGIATSESRPGAPAARGPCA